MKRVFVALLVIIAIAAIVFLIYKAYIEKDEPSVSPSPSVTDTSSPSPTETNSSDITPTTPSDTGISPTPSDTSNPSSPELTSDRDKNTTITFEIEGTDESFDAELFISDFGNPDYKTAYSFYVDTERYNHVRDDNKDMFYTGENAGEGATMEISFHPGTTGEAMSPTFLDSYVDYTDIEFFGNVFVANTGLRGFKIIASNRDKITEAYLIKSGSDVVAFVMSYTPEMAEGHALRMMAMLDTFELED